MSTKNREMPDCAHVDVADGFRAASALLVLWFHFWQQNWLRPEIALPFLAPVGLASINLEWLPRSGYLFVDALLMLSGFCLFLPVARAVAEGRPDAGRIDARDFYRRRVARILPSYLFCLAVILIFCVLPDWPYAAAKDFWTDLLAHLTFTHSFFPASYLGTQLNGALWTLSIEAQFYLLFPLLARWFARAPLRAWAVMNGISLASVAALALLRPDLGMWLLCAAGKAAAARTVGGARLFRACPGLYWGRRRAGKAPGRRTGPAAWPAAAAPAALSAVRGAAGLPGPVRAPAALAVLQPSDALFVDDLF